MQDFGSPMVIEVGRWVRHRGTRMWGEVLEIIPQHDRTLELKVQREKPLTSTGGNAPTWWASYHVDLCIDHKPTEQERRLGVAWAPS